MPIPMSRNDAWRMFARWPVLCIQPLTIERGVASTPEPQAMFSPIDQLPWTYPVLLIRDSGVLEPDSWAKKRAATILLAQARAAFASGECECSAAMPFAARSAFKRQRIAADIAPRFEGAGFADVLEQAPPPATPCVSASVGRFSFGEIGPPLPIVF